MQDAKDASSFLQRSGAVTNYTFSWFEDLYARDAKTPTVVNVSATTWRNVALYQPGRYTARLYYNGGSVTEMHWTVQPTASRKAKNLCALSRDRI